MYLKHFYPQLEDFQPCYKSFARRLMFSGLCSPPWAPPSRALLLSPVTARCRLRQFLWLQRLTASSTVSSELQLITILAWLQNPPSLPEDSWRGSLLMISFSSWRLMSSNSSLSNTFLAFLSMISKQLVITFSYVWTKVSYPEILQLI